MPTKLTRRVVRETNAVDPSYGRRLVIELAEGGNFVYVWQKGRRRKYPITYVEIWRAAIRGAQLAAVREAKAIREAKRKARQKERAK